VAHNYNPGYSGGRDQGAGKKLKKQFMRAYLEKKLTQKFNTKRTNNSF
jgi:hypothetical protein